MPNRTLLDTRRRRNTDSVYGTTCISTRARRQSKNAHLLSQVDWSQTARYFCLLFLYSSVRRYSRIELCRPTRACSLGVTVLYASRSTTRNYGFTGSDRLYSDVETYAGPELRVNDCPKNDRAGQIHYRDATRRPVAEDRTNKSYYCPPV